VCAESVDAFDGKRLVSHVALLFVIVHVDFDIGGGGGGGGSGRRVCHRRRKVVQRISIYFCRYTIDAVVDGEDGGFVAVDAVVSAIEKGVTRVWGRLRVVHDGA